MHNWLLHYGIPKKLITDRGSQFLFQEWKEAMKFLGINHIHKTAYYLLSTDWQKNIQTIKIALKTLT